MKRCPECRRDYMDDTLSYCLADGASLVYGLSDSEPATEILTGDAFGAAKQPSHDISVEVSQKSIAILPFAHLSSDVDDEYFCDGLAEELLNAMTRVDGLKVAARTSSFSFKGRNINIAEVGRELGVATVLEGSVRKSGSRLRITVQLISTADGYHLWSERYDREMRDVFEIQDEITLAVVEALKLKLMGEQRSALLKKGTDNSDAFELYLRGRALWNNRTKDGFQKAIENFEQAIALDPDYALAYAALADCYSFLAYFEAMAPADVASKAKAAVDKAMTLGDEFAECHTAKASYELFFNFDPRAAEAGYSKAIAINPQFLPAHYLYCGLLGTQSRFDEAIGEGRTALKIDPLSPHVNGQLARALCGAGRYEEAIDLIKRILEIMPDFYSLHFSLGWAYGQLQQWDLAISHYRIAAAVVGFLVYGYLGNALINGGQADEARILLDELNEQSKKRYVSPVGAAIIEGALGNISKGLDLLEKAFEMRVVHLIWIGVDPICEVFQNEPKFRDLCRKIGIPIKNGLSH